MAVKEGYKHTEVGVIPEDWEPRNLHECVRSDAPICYGILMPGENIINGVPVIKVRDITNGVIAEDQLLLTHPKIDAAYSRSRLLGGDVLLTIRGTTGRVAVVPPTLNHSNITQDTARIRPKANTNVLFLYFILQCPAVQEQIVLNTVGQAVKGINIRDVKRIAFPFPRTLAEQQAIAGALSDADAWIESLEQLIAKKRQVKQGAMQELLTGKRRLPGFSERWDRKRLGDIASLNRLNIVPQSFPTQKFYHYSLPAYDDGKTPVEELGSTIGSNKFIVPHGAVLVSKLNPRIPRVWAPDEIPEHSVASTEFLVLNPKENVSRQFLFTVCSSPRFCEQMELSATGTTGSHQRISPSGALAIQVSVPNDPGEQTTIATVLSDMDAEIGSLESKLAKAREVKHGMMQELLTGRIRLV